MGEIWIFIFNSLEGISFSGSNVQSLMPVGMQSAAFVRMG